MSREQRIELLLRMAEEQGQEASRALAHRRQVLAESDARLNELIGYRQEYVGGRADKLSTGLGVHFQDYWRFLSRLNTAIDEHRERMNQQAHAVEQSLARWQETQRQVAVLGKVVDRVRSNARRAQERGEQKVLDELARAGAPQPYQES